MTAGKIPGLMIWLAMAFLGLRFAAAQSASVPAGGAASSAAGKNTSTDARAPGTAPSMASQWIAGGKSFGPAADDSWGAKKTTSPTGVATMWGSGSRSFSQKASPGGIWRSEGVPITGVESGAEGATLSNPASGGSELTRGLQVPAGVSIATIPNRMSPPVTRSVPPGKASVRGLEGSRSKSSSSQLQAASARGGRGNTGARGARHRAFQSAGSSATNGRGGLSRGMRSGETGRDANRTGLTTDTLQPGGNLGNTSVPAQH